MHELLLLVAAVLAGAINALAGGGTLLTFPSLLAAGLLPLTANGTSTFALVPGALSSFVGFRKELGTDRRVLWALAAPSVVGGWLGAQLALWSSDALFARLVPWLVLGATLLFAAQERVRRRVLARGEAPAGGAPHRHLLTLAAMQLVVAIYGGYFGAGMGILMLAALGLVGETNLHRMNAMKALAGACINGVGTITFIVGGRVLWRYAVPMAVAAIVGGYVGAHLAQRVGQATVRKIVVLVGLALSAQLLYKQLGA